MYNQIILKKLKDIKSENLAVSRCNFFVIKALLKKEGVTDQNEIIQIINRFNDGFFFSNEKEFDNDFIIPDDSLSISLNDPYEFFFSQKIGNNVFLSNEHKEEIINNQLEQDTLSDTFFTYNNGKIEEHHLDDINIHSFNSFVIIPDMSNSNIYISTLNKSLLDIHSYNSVSKYVIHNIVEDHPNEHLTKKIIETLEFECLDQKYLRYFFERFFSDEEKSYLIDNFKWQDYVNQNIEEDDSFEDDDEDIITEDKLIHKRISSFVGFIHFDFLKQKEISKLYKENVDEYNKYIKYSENFISYYHDNFHGLIDSLNKALPNKKIDFNDLIRTFLSEKDMGFPFRNINFIDIGNIL